MGAMWIPHLMNRFDQIRTTRIHVFILPSASLRASARRGCAHRPSPGPSTPMRCLVRIACLGGRRGRARWPPPYHPRSIPAAATISFASRARGRRGCAHRLPPYHARSICAAATNRSRRASVAVEDVLTVCLRTMLVPSARLRRIVHFACPVAVDEMPPGRLRTMLVPFARLRRIVHFACPVAVEDVLTIRLRTILVPPLLLQRIVHFACPVAVEEMPHGRLRTILAAATPRSRRMSRGRRSDVLSSSAGHPSRATGISGPGVEDGGQDKGVGSRRCYPCDRTT